MVEAGAVVRTFDFCEHKQYRKGTAIKCIRLVPLIAVSPIRYVLFLVVVHFAHQLGLPVYNQLCEKRFLIGEWLFSHPLSAGSPERLHAP